MQQREGEKRTKIVHEFASWTALSALRSGSPIKSRKQIYGLIEKCGNLSDLFDRGDRISEREFDRWHKQTILAIVDAEPALKIASQVGWAAKIINVYLKTRVYVAREGREGLMSVIHLPIDNDLQKGLKRTFPERPWKVKRIKNICSYDGDYFPFVKECRSLAAEEGCFPIELEWYWRGTE